MAGSEKSGAPGVGGAVWEPSGAPRDGLAPAAGLLLGLVLGAAAGRVATGAAAAGALCLTSTVSCS
jgi:hypothetical protein